MSEFSPTPLQAITDILKTYVRISPTPLQALTEILKT